MDSAGRLTSFDRPPAWLGCSVERNVQVNSMCKQHNTHVLRGRGHGRRYPAERGRGPRGGKGLRRIEQVILLVHARPTVKRVPEPLLVDHCSAGGMQCRARTISKLLCRRTTALRKLRPPSGPSSCHSRTWNLPLIGVRELDAAPVPADEVGAAATQIRFEGAPMLMS